MALSLLSEDKLDALRRGDPVHPRASIGDRRTCILCDTNFSGRQVDVAITPMGEVRLHWSEGCRGTPREWVHPANPLISRKAWRDWARLLDGSERKPATGGRRHSYISPQL